MLTTTGDIRKSFDFLYYFYEKNWVNWWYELGIFPGLL